MRDPPNTSRIAPTLPSGDHLLSEYVQKPVPVMAYVVALIAVALVFFPAYLDVFNWDGVRFLGSFEVALAVMFGAVGLALLSFIVESVRHGKNASKLHVRVEVNGSRGKTTTVHLIGAGLRTRYRTLDKTTGKSEALLSLTDDHKPDPQLENSVFLQRFGPPRITEQLKVMKVAAEMGCEAFVVETMALNPKYAQVCSRKIIRPTIEVITNAMADHLDIQGPTVKDVARSLCATIPKNGIVVSAEKRYRSVIEEAARNRNAKVIFVDVEQVPDEYLEGFTFPVFKENLAVALKVCELAGVPPKEALEGMLRAGQDPGTLRTYEHHLGNNVFYCVNACGVNDPESTLRVYDSMAKGGYFQGRRVIGFFHARPDRVVRSVQFGQAVMSMHFDRIFVAGGFTKHFVRNAIAAGYPRENIADLADASTSEILRFIESVGEKDRPTVIFGFGNMIGLEDMVEYLEKNANLIPVSLA